jgi:DNA-binding NarL/FixJ family response regulator
MVSEVSRRSFAVELDRVTPAEAKMLPLLANGRSPRAMAESLGLSPGTAKKRQTEILSKAQCRKTQFVALVAAGHMWLDGDRLMRLFPEKRLGRTLAIIG